MANVKFYLDSRATKPGNPSPLKLQISHNRKTFYIPLNIRLFPEQWNATANAVVGHPQMRMLNQVIKQKMAMIQLSVINVTGIGGGNNMSASELKDVLMREINGEPQEEEKENRKGVFEERFRLFGQTRRSKGSRDIYERTLRQIKSYDPEIESKNFEDIDRVWLDGFDLYLQDTSPSPNSRAIHMRNIRAVFNDAIDDGITNSYPFRKFKIKTVPTRKRSLNVEQLRNLATYPCEEYQEKYRDIFMLMFMLCGVNPVDLLNAKADSLYNGRFEYIRAKTGKFYSIKVEPEAMNIINKYRGEEYLLSFMDTRQNYVDWLRRMDSALKKIGPMERVGRGGKKIYHPLFPKLSQYWCRHTWATLAAELDIPKETIAAGLGHGGNTVTDIYIRFDQKKVDRANRAIIDYFLGVER